MFWKSKLHLSLNFIIPFTGITTETADQSEWKLRILHGTELNPLNESDSYKA